MSTAPPANGPPCPPPGTPDNGYLLPVYGPQDQLVAVRYRCYPPFTLIGSHQRVCQRDASWSGEVPTCVKGDSFFFNPNRRLLPGLVLHVYSRRMHLGECSLALINTLLQVRQAGRGAPPPQRCRTATTNRPPPQLEGPRPSSTSATGPTS